MNKRHALALLRLIAELYEVINTPDPPPDLDHATAPSNGQRAATPAGQAQVPVD